jgi:hypothetical protein
MYFHLVFTVHFPVTLINHQHNALYYDKAIYYLFIYPDISVTRDTQSTQPCRTQRERSTDLYTNTPTACMNLHSLRPITDDCTTA